MFTVSRPVQVVSQRKTPLDGLKGQRFFCNNLLAPSGGCVTEIPRIVYLVVRTTPLDPTSVFVWFDSLSVQSHED